jgi:hypothetical protein
MFVWNKSQAYFHTVMAYSNFQICVHKAIENDERSHAIACVSAFHAAAIL